MSSDHDAADVDVIVVGTGFAGTILGAILARHGVRTLLLDATSHPRFAIGESTVPATTLMLELLAHRYDLPELLNLTSPERLYRAIAPTSGIKGHFGYVYHTEGQPFDPREVMQLGVSKLIRHEELHYFRQDVDAYLLRVAIRRGATVRQNVRITDVEVDGDGVRVTGSRGEVFRARYVVDGSGYRSVLADRFGLRDDPTPLRSRTRSLFTHMIDVRPFDECLPSRDPKLPIPWANGTLHHVFEGGWLWVIPFNNHPASTNPLVSVGLTLNLERNPPRTLPPEVEFANFLERFPLIGAQFRDARPVREWISTDRLQYSSARCFGERYGLLSHAAGFVDPFYSRGLVNSIEVINGLAAALLDAVRSDDFSTARFEALELLQRKLIDYNDRLVHGTYFAFRSFRLWNAWNRIWVLGTYAAEGRMIECFDRYRLTGDPAELRVLEHPPCPGHVFPFHAWYDELFRACEAELEAAMDGRQSDDAAAERIFRHFWQSAYTDSHWADPRFRPVLWALLDEESPYLFIRPGTFVRSRNAWLAKRWQRERGEKTPYSILRGAMWFLGLALPAEEIRGRVRRLFRSVHAASGTWRSPAPSDAR